MGTKYSGDIVAGSLLIPESRKIATLLLNKVSKKDWLQAINIENILQKRSPLSARRQANLIRKRLLTMTPELWKMIIEGTSEVATQAVLAATVKDSRLLGDFMQKTVHEKWQMFEKKLSLTDFNNYFDTCSQIDPSILKWSDSTKKKVREVIIRILSESGYLSSTRSLNLLPVNIHPDVAGYLRSHKEEYALKSLQATQ